MQDGSVVHFKIKRNTQLKKLMQAYCDRQGFQMNSIRFMFDGNHIGPDTTPSEVSTECPSIITEPKKYIFLNCSLKWKMKIQLKSFSNKLVGIN